MKTLKKALCLMMAILAVCSFCACGGTSKPMSESIEAPAENPVDAAKAKLAEAYNTCCEGSKTRYAKLGYDKMSLTIDTNPDDTEYYNQYESDATGAIRSINHYLNLPSSLLDKMSGTRALDGTLTQNCGTYTVTWNYHPDSGLKVIYEVNP